MNSKISLTGKYWVAALAAASLVFSSCQKKDPILGALPSPSFTSVALTPASGAASNIQLINTTPDHGIAFWTIPGLGSFKGDTVNVAFVFAGTYPVQLVVAGHGGIDSVTQSVTVDKDNPYAADSTTILGVLTGAGFGGQQQRTWTAERVVNSVIVWDNYADCLGQIAGGGGAWWAFGAGEIDPKTGRNGYLDDQYTFTFGKTGQLIYDDNNTVYLDGGSSSWTGALPAPWNSYSGTTSSTDLYNLVPALKPWGSGSFTYTTAASGGAMGLGTITVKGTGAHVGLPDKTNGGDETTPTASSVTYDVLKINTGLTDINTGAIYDEVILGVAEPNLVWTFMFRSDR